MATATAAAQPKLKTPYPWFGGKSKASHLIWQALGDSKNYVEPFFGGGAALLLRPDYDPLRHIETVNDLNCNLANFWRALQADPDAVADHADWPVNEVDVVARHQWLSDRTYGTDFAERMMGDPSFYDAQQAGWWVWGLAAWIGGGFCRPPRKLPHLGDGGRGVQRQLPHLGDGGQGVQRQLPHLGDGGRGDLREYFYALAERTRKIRVCCGDWSRVLTPSVTTRHAGVTGVLLDPPYLGHEKTYTESGSVSGQTREWAIANGDNPKFRIVLCGYSGEHAMPAGWREVAWKATKGYATAANTKRAEERLWLSPHCLPVEGEVSCD